jgi:hypothetical protein
VPPAPGVEEHRRVAALGEHAREVVDLVAGVSPAAPGPARRACRDGSTSPGRTRPRARPRGA